MTAGGEGGGAAQAAISSGSSKIPRRGQRRRWSPSSGAEGARQAGNGLVHERERSLLAEITGDHVARGGDGDVGGGTAQFRERCLLRRRNALMRHFLAALGTRLGLVADGLGEAGGLDFGFFEQIGRLGERALTPLFRIA